MKLFARITGLILLLVTVDIGRYCFIPDIEALKDFNPEKTALMRYCEKRSIDAGQKKVLTLRRVSLTNIFAISSTCCTDIGRQ